MDRSISSKLCLDKGSKTAVYIQIASQLKELISQGVIMPGTQLTERELADAYNVGRSTVTAALDILKETELINTIPKKGTFVHDNVWSRFVENSIPDWFRYIKHGNYPESRSELQQPHFHYKKSGSRYALNEAYSPYEPLRKAYRDMSESANLHDDLNTFDMRGLPALREALVDHLANYSIKTSVDNIVLFSGYVEALSTLSRAYMAQGSNLYCMQTDQIAYYPTFRSVSANIYEIPRDNNGPIPESFEKMIKHGKLNMLYINPVNCFPTGITYSAERMAAIRNICFKYSIPIIENDFLRDIWVNEPPRPMKAFDTHNQVIYIGAMATTFASGASLAWVVLPDMAIDRVLYVKTFMHTPTNTSNELLAYNMLAKGYYTEYIEALRAKMPEIMERTNHSLEKHLTGLAEWEPHNLNYTTWLKLNSNVNANAIVRENPYYISEGKVFTDKSNYLFAHTLSMTPEQFEDMAYHCARSIKKRT